MTVPVWLLDVDGVVNACSRKPDGSVWPKDQWLSGKAQNRDGEFPILWAQPVVDFIRDVHESGRAEVRWHTTWQKDAAAIEALCGLPAFEVAVAPEFDAAVTYAAEAIREGRPDWWKLPSAERVVRDEKRPLVWTDDDITYSLKRYDADAGLRAYSPALLVSPNDRTGLTPKHLRRIGDFLDLHAAAGGAS
ncbi:hypothetical protein Rhe02_54220 [Rhizocola hellebori]|uniref:Uncharacterized protein n=1 Tax=Rhizocola hellebori TaxID=1392758 RepID=A0A8J3QCX1_9ACTN|nr:hypothetical protein [Rhizocola hellebori]GIH07355.1 hypothetical protein Rhe02_54220 [Rhizocola hellebori]